MVDSGLHIKKVMITGVYGLIAGAIYNKLSSDPRSTMCMDWQDAVRIQIALRQIA